MQSTFTKSSCQPHSLHVVIVICGVWCYRPSLPCFPFLSIYVDMLHNWIHSYHFCCLRYVINLDYISYFLHLHLQFLLPTSSVSQTVNDKLKKMRAPQSKPHPLPHLFRDSWIVLYTRKPFVKFEIASCSHCRNTTINLKFWELPGRQPCPYFAPGGPYQAAHQIWCR